MVYNIPSRTTLDLSNDLLAELAQLDHVDAVKQANPEHLAIVDGLDLYAGNDDMLADVVALGGAGGICVASHLAGDEMRRMVDEPDRAREIHDRLLDLFDEPRRDHEPDPDQGRAAARRPGLRRPAAPARGGRRGRDRPVRARWTRSACSAPRAPPSRARRSPSLPSRERHPARPAPRGPRRDRQEHDRRRVRRQDRRRRHRTALPDGRHARHRPRPARLLLPARARAGHRGDHPHPRPRGPRRRPALGACARSGARPAAGLRRQPDDRDGPLQARRAPAQGRPARGARAGRRARARPVRRRRWCT